MTSDGRYVKDMGDRPPDTPSITKIYPAVADVMDATKTTPGKVQPGLLPDVPAGIAPGAFRRPGHVRDLQVLDPDHVEPPRDVRGDLLGPVLAPVRLAGPQPGDRVLHPAAAVRSPLSAGERALQPPQPGPLPRGRGGAGQHLAGGQGRGDRHPPVDAHGLAVTRCGNRPGITAKAARPCATTAARPGSPGRRTRPSPGRSRAAPAAAPSGSLPPATGARPAPG